MSISLGRGIVSVMADYKVYVIGAGIVGICCAIFIRQRGFDVYLLDRKQPAQETSFGNSGVICDSYLLPSAKPSLLKKLPRMLLNLDHRFHIHYPHLPYLASWLGRFVANCNRRTMERRVPPLNHLLSSVIETHVELMQQSGATRYLNDSGWLRLYTDKRSFADTVEERYYYDKYNISYNVLDWSQIQKLEPDLTQEYECGIWLDRVPSARNPGAVCTKYTEYFQSLGGSIVQSEVTNLHKTDRGWSVHSDQGQYSADQVVVALGAWSPQFLGRDGLNNPIAVERGYHLLFEPADGKRLTRCIIDIDQGYVMTPMEMGIRVTSATDLVARDTAPNYKQINDLVPKIRSTFPLGEMLLSEPWMGRRPSTADSLPIIGPSRDQPNLWYAFGHGHLGFSLGPVTGKIIACAVAGEPWDSRNDPFLPSRFML